MGKYVCLQSENLKKFSEECKSYLPGEFKFLKLFLSKLLHRLFFCLEVRRVKFRLTSENSRTRGGKSPEANDVLFGIRVLRLLHTSCRKCAPLPAAEELLVLRGSHLSWACSES